MDQGTEGASPGESRQAQQGDRSRAWPTVLVVDNEARNRLFLWPLLRDDYRIIEAENAATESAVLERERVNLVLLDVMMPETGFGPCEKSKSSVRPRSCPCSWSPRFPTKSRGTLRSRPVCGCEIRYE